MKQDLMSFRSLRLVFWMELLCAAAAILSFRGNTALGQSDDAGRAGGGSGDAKRNRNGSGTTIDMPPMEITPGGATRNRNGSGTTIDMPPMEITPGGATRNRNGSGTTIDMPPMEITPGGATRNRNGSGTTIDMPPMVVTPGDGRSGSKLPSSSVPASRVPPPDLGKVPEYDLNLASILQGVRDPGSWDWGALRRAVTKIKAEANKHDRDVYEAIFGDLDELDNFAFHAMDDGRVDSREMAYVRALVLRLCGEDPGVVETDQDERTPQDRRPRGPTRGDRQAPWPDDAEGDGVDEGGDGTHGGREQDRRDPTSPGTEFNDLPDVESYDEARSNSLQRLNRASGQTNRTVSTGTRIWGLSGAD